MAQPDASGQRGIAICGNCGSDTFRLKIYSCGKERAHCSGCDTAWEADWQEELWQAASRREGQDIRGDEAVESVEHVSGDLVQPTGGSQESYRLGNGGVVVKTGKTDRKAYLREYMKKRREEERKARDGSTSS